MDEGRAFACYESSEVVVELSGILFVVVYVVDVGNNVNVSGCVDNGTHGIKSVSEVVNCSENVLVASFACFVEGTPTDDGRMVVVSVDFCEPFGNDGEKGSGILFVKTPVREFAPEEVAELVCVIDVSGFKHLHVHTSAVEACRL